MPNKVLVKLEKRKEDDYAGFDNIKFINTPEGKVKIEIDPTYNPNWLVSVKGEVEKVCERLYFDDCEEAVDGRMRGMPWDTDIEVKKGDLIYYEYSAVSKAMNLGNFFSNSLHLICEGNIYIIINYNDIFLKKVEDDLIPVNGYVIVEMIKGADFETSLEIPDYIKFADKAGHVKVLYEGTPNKAYRHYTHKAIASRGINAVAEYDFTDEKLVGKYAIANNPGSLFPIENELNCTLTPGLRVIQRRYIICTYHQNYLKT